MYLLDTNVVSELRKAKAGRADLNVAAWADEIPPSSLFLSVITLEELEIGVRLAERRDPPQGATLRAWLDNRVVPAFADRVLPISIEIARRSAALHVPDPRPFRDTLIAATALVHGMTIVTRNTDDFEPTGVDLLNPWSFGPALGSGSHDS